MAVTDNPTAQQVRSAANIGTVIFGGFSALSAIVSLVKGIVPIYLAEAVFWGALAWFWHKKNPRSVAATWMVLLLAIAVVAGEGFMIGRRSTASKDPLKRGNDFPAQLSPDVQNTIRGAELATINPPKLLKHCGAPTLDSEGTVKSQTLGVLPSRKMVYRTAVGATVAFSFISLDDGASWVLPRIFDSSGRSYDVSSDADVSRLWTVLPCLPE